MKPGIKLAIGLTLLAALLVLSRWLPLVPWVKAVLSWLEGAGPMGVLVFVFAYGLATVAMLPGSLITLGAGFVYGPLIGLLVVSPASVLGATLAFLVGRFLARDWVKRQVEKNPRFSRLDEEIGKESFRLILLLRLSPIFPYSLLNYALGVTRASLTHYVLASFLGMIPATFMYLYLGSSVEKISDILIGKPAPSGNLSQIWFAFGAVATLAATVMITKVARKALKEAVKENG